MEKEGFTYPTDGTILNCNQCDDMAEYMSCCDAFMTDYSSSVFDVIHTEKPCFLYANDEEEYMKKREAFTSPLMSFRTQLFVIIKNFWRLWLIMIKNKLTENASTS